MVVRHKLKREFVLGVTVPGSSQETREFQSLKEMDAWLDSEFRGYPVGTEAFHGGERYVVLPDTEEVPEPWQSRAAFIRKVGLAFLAGGGFWLVVGLILASHGGLHVLGKAGLSMAYLGGILYGAAWLAGYTGLSTAALEKRVAKWADGVARTAMLRWRWRRMAEYFWRLRYGNWRGLVSEYVNWTWSAWGIGERSEDSGTHGTFTRRQAMREAEAWLWSQAREESP